MSYDELLPSPLLPNGKEALSFADSYALYDKFCKVYWNPVSGEWQARIVVDCLSSTPEEAKSRYNAPWDDDYCIIAHHKDTVVQMDNLLTQSKKMKEYATEQEIREKRMDMLHTQDIQRAIIQMQTQVSRKMEQRVIKEMEALNDISPEEEGEN